MLIAINNNINYLFIILAPLLRALFFCHKSKDLSISQLLQKPVEMMPDSVGPLVKKRIDSLQPGQIILLENLRFHPGEETPEKEPSFAKDLSAFGDFYVNDAFGTAHRAHASTALIAKYF